MSVCWSRGSSSGLASNLTSGGNCGRSLQLTRRAENLTRGNCGRSLHMVEGVTSIAAADQPRLTKRGWQYFLNCAIRVSLIHWRLFHSAEQDRLVEQAILRGSHRGANIITQILWNVYLRFTDMYFLNYKNHISLGVTSIAAAESRPAWEAALVRSRWPTASDGQSLPVAFTHCHNYFHFLRFYVFNSHFLSF